MEEYNASLLEKIEDIKLALQYYMSENVKLNNELESAYENRVNEFINKNVKVDVNVEEDIIKKCNDIIWERDYYKLRFEELNKNWNKVIKELLGEDYYNYGCDWQTCDNFTAEDLIYKYKKRWWQFWK